MNDEGLADVEAANPFRLLGLHPGVGSDVDAGKIEQLKNLLADTKSLSTPDQNQQLSDFVA